MQIVGDVVETVFDVMLHGCANADKLIRMLPTMRSMFFINFICYEPIGNCKAKPKPKLVVCIRCRLNKLGL